MHGQNTIKTLLDFYKFYTIGKPVSRAPDSNKTCGCDYFVGDASVQRVGLVQQQLSKEGVRSKTSKEYTAE